jgi:type III restriction enzyme
MTSTLRHAEVSQVKYDLIGKISEGTVLTRRTVARILKGIRPQTFAMFQQNPEEFIRKVIHLIREQKATMIVEHIAYNQIEGSYDSSIFTAEKHGKPLEAAFTATKAIQDYVYTDGTAERSVERRFVENLDRAEEVNIYANFPRASQSPPRLGTIHPTGNRVHEGAVRHIYFGRRQRVRWIAQNFGPLKKPKLTVPKSCSVPSRRAL